MSCEIKGPNYEAAKKALGIFNVSDYLAITDNKGPIDNVFLMLDKLAESYPERKDIYEARRIDLKNKLDNTSTIASNIFELEPGITEERIQTIYDNYVGLMGRAREGSEMPYETFRSILENYQVYKHKDTYIFGQWDVKNAVFLERVFSSPSSKQLLAEAIPNLTKNGIDSIAFVPEDMAKKYARSGYEISKEGFDYNFKGEQMVKYLATSNPRVARKIFKKDLADVTSKEAAKYNKEVPFRYQAVQVNEELIQKAGRETAKILETYLNQFGIVVKDIDAIKEQIGIDELGFADILSKIAYVKNRSNLPPIAGEFIAYMMQYNALVKNTINELIQTDVISIPKDKYTLSDDGYKLYNYEKLDKTEFFKYIGNLISQDLQNKLETGTQSKSLIDKIKKLLKAFFKALSLTDFSMINTNIGSITNNIIAQNKKMITASVYKPGAVGKQTTQVSLEKALSKDAFGKRIIYELSTKGFILTGSTAVSEQGTVLRPDENLLHDIDWVSPFSREETLEKFFESYPDAIKVRDILGGGAVTDTYIIADKGYSVVNYITEDYADSLGNVKTIVKAYDVVNDKGELKGTYRLVEGVGEEKAQEVVTGVEAKVIDLFSYDDYETTETYKPFTFITKDGQVIKLSNWKSTFRAKLDFARYKDIWDYNRYMPDDNVVAQPKEESYPQYARDLFDVAPAVYKKELMKRYKHPTLKNMLSVGGYVDAVNAVNAYNRANGNLRHLDVVKAETNLRASNQGYYIKVFKTPEPITPISPGSKENGVDRAWFVREIQAIDELNSLLDTSEDDTINSIQVGTITQQQLDATQALQVVKNLAASMNMLDEFGEADVQFITKDQALELTKNTADPYNNEPAFFFNNKVYVVDGAISVNSLFHEFSHPFVKYISKLNPELFENLAIKSWNELGALGLQERFLQTYPRLDVNSKGFKEEVIVHALTVAGQAELAGQTMPRSFREFISNVLYQIKKYIKQMLGKGINISDLGVNTSLRDLANEMLTNEFQINDDIVTEEDEIQYSRELRFEIGDYIEDVENALNDDKQHQLLQRNLNQLYKLANEQLRATENTDKYQEVALALMGEDNRDLAYITSSLNKYVDIPANQSRNVTDLLEENRKKAIAFVNSMKQMDIIAQKINDAIDNKIANITNSVDSLYSVSYFNDFLDSYKDFLEKLEFDLTAANVPLASPIRILKSQILDKVNAGKQKSQSIYGEGLIDALWEFVEPLANKIDTRWLKRKAYLQNSITASPRLLALEETLYESVKLTKEKFGKMINGQIINESFGSQMNSLFESYLVNQDPVVGSFASFLKKNYSEMNVTVQDLKNKFASQVVPALEKAGVNAFNITDKANQLLMEDSVGKYVKDGEDTHLMEYKVLKYLDEFVGYEWWDQHQGFLIETARNNYYASLSDADRKELNRLKQDYERMRRLYFHNKYKPEFYEKEELFERDAIGAEAKTRLDEIREELQIINDLKRNGFEVKDETERRKIALQNRRKLYSLYDEFGNLKEDDERLIAERLREYRDLSQGFYYSKQRPGVFLKALQDFEDQLFLRGLKRSDAEFLEERGKWLTKNTRMSVAPAYYDALAALYDNIRELEDKKKENLKDVTAAFIKEELLRKGVDQNIIDDVTTVADLYSVINDISSLYRDDSRVIAANEISDEAVELIKKIQEVIVYTRENSSKINNLTQEENDFLLDYVQRFTMANFNLGPMPSTDEQIRANELFDTQKENGLSKEENQKLAEYYAALSTLRKKMPTNYYLDIYTSYIATIDKQFIIDAIADSDIDVDNADKFLEVSIVDGIKRQNPAFADWFDKNHIKVKTYDKANPGQWKDMWQRLQVWDYSAPAEDKFYESMEIPTAEDPTKTEPFYYMPNLEYYSFDVKPEWETEIVEPNTRDVDGKIIPPNVDNKGNWLPKRVAQGAPDNKFINADYQKLKTTNKDMFDALEKIKEYHLEIQESKERSTRLYLELPRYDADIQEDAAEAGRTVSNGVKSIFVSRKGKKKKNVGIFARWYEDFLAFFSKRPDSYQEGDANFVLDDTELEQISFFTNKTAEIPIEGKALLDINNVSRNFVKSQLRYMASLEKHQKLVDLLPMANALNEFLLNPISGRYKTAERINKKSKLSNTSTVISASNPKKVRKFLRNLPKNAKNFAKGELVREKSLEYLIQREFYGQKQGGGLNNNVTANNIIKFLGKAASIKYFALDLTSALVNYYDALVEVKIEAYGGKYMSPWSLQFGKIWGVKAMSTITAEIYKTGPKSVTGQLIEVFDPGQGSLKDALDDGLSRNIIGDTLKLNFLTNTRKWLETLATMQAMGSMMNYVYVDQTIGTKTKKIKYINAWEVGVDGKIKLKEGVDKSYDINGKNFLKVKNTMQQVITNINGAFSEYDQPQAGKFVIYRMAAFIQKHFTPMLLNRYGTKGNILKGTGVGRYDWGANDVNMGFYTAVINYLMKGLRTFGSGLANPSKEEAYYIQKSVRWILMLMLTGYIKTWYFGFDPEKDEEDALAEARREGWKNPKVRTWDNLYKKSAPLPLFGAKYEDKKVYNSKGKKVKYDRTPFDLKEWGKLNMLYVTTRVGYDQEDWLLYPGMGLSNLANMFQVKTGAIMQPTYLSGVELVDLLAKDVAGERSAYFQNESGAYGWEKAGDEKWKATFMRMFGFTGGVTDPIDRLENLVTRRKNPAAQR